MDKDLKRQIKEDEFRSGLEHAWAYAKTHASQLRVAGGVVGLAAATLFAVGIYRAGQTSKSEAEFQAALEIYQSPVGGDAQAASAFKTTEERFTKAAAAFDGVERRYGSTPAGRRARLLGAVSRVQLGQAAEGRKVLEAIAAERGGDGIDAALAGLALAQSYAASGELDKAVAAYRDLVDRAGLPFGRDFVLMELGSALEQARKYDEARATFQRVVDEFPVSAQAQEAAQRVERLAGAARG